MSINDKISVVIPAYNEEIRLARNLPKIIDFMSQNFKIFDIIIVDDGSTDKTVDICKKYLKKCSLVILKNKNNMGKGFSVKKGVLKAKGDYILVTDSDLSTPIEELSKLLEYSKSNDVIIGSRSIDESIVKTRLFKKILGRFSNILISFIVKDIKDTQCGFKLFNKSVAKKIFSNQTINRWGFDFEILYIAQKIGYSIKEVPVTWIEDINSKVRLIDYPKTLIDLLMILYNIRFGKYKFVEDE